MHPLSPQRFHIVFSDSGGGALKYAASKLRGEPLKGFLPYGPIYETSLGPLDLIARPAEHRAWLEAHEADTATWWGLDAKSQSESETAVAGWWNQLRADPPPTTIWHCSRDAGDVSFLLALANEIPFSEDTLLVDVARMETWPEPITSVGGCAPERVLEAAGKAITFGKGERDLLKQEFRRLVSAPKGLRRFDEAGMLREAAIDSHDETILQFVQPDWRRYRNVAADLFNFQRDRSVREIAYSFMLWRVDHLIRTGRIERRDASTEPLFTEDPMMGDLRLVADN